MNGGRATTNGSTVPPPSPGLTVGLVDGDPLSTFRLRRLLRPYVDRVSVVDGLAGTDLVLIDPHLHMSDITDVADLVDTMSADGVVVYTWGPACGLSGPEGLQAAGWPLRGWLSKGLDADTLVDALERIHDGGWVCLEAPDPLRRLRSVPQGAPTLPSLTPREGQIISLVSAGLTNRQIADRSYLSVNSVKTYISSAYRKMGISRRTQAIVWGVQHDRGTWPPRAAGWNE